MLLWECAVHQSEAFQLCFQETKQENCILKENAIRNDNSVSVLFLRMDFAHSRYFRIRFSKKYLSLGHLSIKVSALKWHGPMISKYLKTKAITSWILYIQLRYWCAHLFVLHIRNNFEFVFTQLLEEDYCLRHHHNKTGYMTFGKPAKSILWVFFIAQIALKVAILHPH